MQRLFECILFFYFAETEQTVWHLFPYKMGFYSPSNFNLDQSLKNRELNHLRKNYRFEKKSLFHCVNLGLHLTYNLRGAWHTLYAMLLSSYKWDDTTDMLP